MAATHGAWPFKWELLTDISSGSYSIDNDPESLTYGFVTFTSVAAGTYSVVVLCTDQYLQTTWVELTSVQFIDATTDNGANFVVLQPDGTNVSGVAGSWNNPHTLWDQMYLGGAIQAHSDSTYANHIVLIKGTGELSPVIQFKLGNTEKPRHIIFLNGSTVTVNTSTYPFVLDVAKDDISVVGPGIFDCHSTCEDTQKAGVFTAANATDICTFTTNITNITTGSSYTLSNSGGALPTGLSATTYYAIRVTDTTFRLATTYANALAGTYVTFSDDGTGTHTATDSGTIAATGRPCVFAFQKVTQRATLAGFTIQNYTGTGTGDNPGPITGTRDNPSFHYTAYAITFDNITGESANGSLVKLMSAGRECVIDGIFASNVTSFQGIIALKHNATDVTIRRIVAYDNCEFGTAASGGAVAFFGGSLRSEVCFCELGSSNDPGIDWHTGSASSYALPGIAVFRNTVRATGSARQSFGLTNIQKIQPPPTALITRNIFQSRRPSVRASSNRLPFAGADLPINDNKIGVAGLVDATFTPLIDWDGKYGAKRVYYA